jgi:hypothetical protein
VAVGPRAELLEEPLDPPALAGAAVAPGRGVRVAVALRTGEGETGAG